MQHWQALSSPLRWRIPTRQTYSSAIWVPKRTSRTWSRSLANTVYWRVSKSCGRGARTRRPATPTAASWRSWCDAMPRSRSKNSTAASPTRRRCDSAGARRSRSLCSLSTYRPRLSRSQYRRRRPGFHSMRSRRTPPAYARLNEPLRSLSGAAPPARYLAPHQDLLRPPHPLRGLLLPLRQHMKIALMISPKYYFTRFYSKQIISKSNCEKQDFRKSAS